MANDIDIGAYCDEELANSNGGWTPIGTSSNKFKGIFDGNGFVIENLKIDRDANRQGFFGYTGSGSEIKNLGIEGGSVKGKGYVGGLVGCSHGAKINNSYSTGDVTGTGSSVGGLVGWSAGSSSINNSYATGDVTGAGVNVGGLLGYSDSSSTTISSSYATGDVSGTSRVGGLLGLSNDSKISNSYATGDVTGTGSDVGGLVGYSKSKISNSYATGTVSGASSVGGLVGAYSYTTISNSASVQSDSRATQMTEEEIKATYTPEVMGFTETAGWTIVDGQPLLSWQKEAQPPAPEGGTGGTGGTTGGTGGATGVSSFILQIGINGDSSCQIGFDTNFTYDLSVVGADITSDEALGAIDNFINLLSEKQTHLGSVQNRLESALDSISVNIENLVSSLSTIKDADIAEVSSTYIQQQILQQASATLLATANQTPSIALQLI